MKYTPQETISTDEIEMGLKNLTLAGLFVQLLGTLTGGVFLVAFALKLNASNTLIGLIAAVPAFMQLIQLPSIFLIEKLKNRRMIFVYSTVVSRAMWFLVALSPLILPVEFTLTLLVVFIIINSAFSAVGSISWDSWMRDFVPQERLGRFFSRRMSIAIAVSIPISLLAGVYLDFWKESFPRLELHGYSLLFCFGAITGLISTYLTARVPEPMMTSTVEKSRLLKLIQLPFKDRNYKNLLYFTFSWNFAVNLAAPFFTVYMLQRLGFSMSIIIGFSILSQIVSVVFLRIWGKLSDQFSNKSVLSVSGSLFMICILAWAFTTLPEKYALTIPLLVLIHIGMGLSTSGVTLTSGNIALKLAPKGQATSYLAVNTLVNSLAASIAPIFGGYFADYLAGRELSLTMKWVTPVRESILPVMNLRQWDFFFLMAFIIGLISLFRLRRVQEIGEVEEKIIINQVISEVTKGMRNFSTIGGLRHMVQFPFSVLHASRKINDPMD